VADPIRRALTGARRRGNESKPIRPATLRATSLPFRNDLSTTNGGAASVANRSLPPPNGATLLRTHTIKAGETLAAVAPSI